MKPKCRTGILFPRFVAVFPLWVVIACLTTSAVAAGEAGGSRQQPELAPDLTELSLQDLMNVEVTSASKKAEKLLEVPAAVFVITEEDIRRSGATSIPELLRMVPGVQVAHIDGNKWAISARGFNDRFANKLLVLIDGRSVYTPLFSGVYWDVQDTLLEDIDRIEVIRGPGGTLWGANAVNGVINIITKRAEDSQGTLVTTGIGTEEKGFVGVRHGGLLGDDGHYRVYGKWFDRDEGAGGADDWHMSRLGLRTDWPLGKRDSLTAQGDLYDGQAGETATLPMLTPPFSRTFDAKTNVSGGNVLLRWERELSEASDLALQLYYDRTERQSAFFSEDRDTLDLDFQHRFPVGSRHEVLWGVGYRVTPSDTDDTFAVSLAPASCTYRIFNVFVQDEITLVEDRLELTVGTKLERHKHARMHTEVEPNARILWRPSEGEAAWAAVSRAIRVPSCVGHEGRINASVTQLPGGGHGLISIFGVHELESEELVAYELGYRTQATDRLFVDVAGFYNRYDELLSFEPGDPFFEASPPPPHLVLPYAFDNKMSGETYGVEVAAQWQARDWWRLDAACSFLRTDLHLDEDSGDTTSLMGERRNPRYQFSLRSAMDLPGDVELDWWLRYVDALPSLDVGSYITADVRLGWQPSENLELSIVGQNLLESGDPQFAPGVIRTRATRVERGVYADATWRF